LLFPIWELFVGFFRSTAFIVLPRPPHLNYSDSTSRKGGPVFVALPDEPEGWQTLQAMAQRESDPVKLAAIIDQMNSLLCWYEGRATAVERNTYEPERLPEQKLERCSSGQEV
jgi:hypothetical protein